MKHHVRTQPTEDKSVCKKLLNPTQSMFKYWIRPGCSGLHPVWASNLPDWRQPKLPGSQPHCCTIFTGKRFLLISSLSLLCFSLHHCLLLSTHALLWKDKHSFIPLVPGMLLGAHKLPLLQLKQPWPHSLSFQAKGPSPWLRWSHFTENSPVVDAFLVMGVLKLDAVKYI